MFQKTNMKAMKIWKQLLRLSFFGREEKSESSMASQYLKALLV